MITENDLEVGRKFGASSFFIYQILKYRPHLTTIDLVIETGLSKSCINNSLSNLLASGLIDRKLIPRNTCGWGMGYLYYTTNEQIH
jgi:predicted transcriptional regulator